MLSSSARCIPHFEGLQAKKAAARRPVWEELCDCVVGLIDDAYHDGSFSISTSTKIHTASFKEGFCTVAIVGTKWCLYMVRGSIFCKLYSIRGRRQERRESHEATLREAAGRFTSLKREHCAAW